MSTIALRLLAVFFTATACAQTEPAQLINELRQADPSYHIAKRGQDFAVFRRIAASTNAGGAAVFQTNEVILLENGLHYLQDGEWTESRDVVEPFPDGAVARYGPHRTIFSTELKTEAVFDIETADGHRIRGGVRAIQLTDAATGKSTVLATVRDGVRGEVIPPNQVVYRSGFDGLDADVLFVWRHNQISQNVILKKRPALAPGMNPATTRLEVVSELVESPEPVLNPLAGVHPDQAGLRDHATIGIGSLMAMRGRAFPVNDDRALVLTGEHLTGDRGVFVAKEFHQLEDRRKFIIEPVGWEEIQPFLSELGMAKAAEPVGAPSQQMADARAWPERLAPLERREPLQVASVPYQDNGFLVDIDLTGYVTNYTFLSGATYYIAQQFYIAGTTTTAFQPGCTIKYGTNAQLLLSCPFSFPPSGQMMPVFTSKDDDLFGALIPGSTHNPTNMAQQAILVYYVTQPQTEIRNMRIRWAKTGIQYEAGAGSAVTHTVRDSLFQQCLYGINGNLPDGSIVLVNVTRCNVTTPFKCTCGEGYSGSMTEDCGPLYVIANFAGLNEQDAGISIPDTMGAVGPNHFMVVLNGSSPSVSVAVYDKYTGAFLSSSTLVNLFSVTVTNGPFAGEYPEGAFDPRLLYDHLSQRWIASAIDGPRQRFMLAVSNSSDPVGTGGTMWVSNNWKKYIIPFVGSCGLDFDTLGVDGNGIYICALANTGCSGNMAALPKAPFIAGTAQTVQTNFILQAQVGPSLYGAVNFDLVTTNDPAWFMSSSGGDVIFYNKLRWTNGFASPPTWEFSFPWPSLTITQSVAPLSLTAPQLGSANRVLLQAGGRIMTALARSVGGTQHLWTCRNIQVNNAGNNDNPQTNPADRIGVEWIKIQTAPTIGIIANGRIYDPAATNQRFYYMPSLAVNTNGDMIVGFSGSSANQYVGAYYWGKLNNGASSTTPVLFFAGKDWLDCLSPFTQFRWGDYSHTTLDPDGLTIWTIQEYAETRYFPLGAFFNAFGTRIGAITPF